MDVEYWDQVAANYDDEIFDSINLDLNGIIKRRVEQYQSQDYFACDFGCGVGKYLPLLARCFKTLYAVDHSEELLKVARVACAGQTNIRFIRSDLSRTKLRIPKIRFAVCTNVLIAPAHKKRLAILRNIQRHQPHGGHLLLLVPSTESALYANQRLIEWNRRAGYRGEELMSECLPATARSAKQLLNGTIPIQGVLTKHYLREEILLMLEGQGYETVSVDKLEFAWRNEFDNPPSWMQSPFPWDWLLVARKK